MPPKRNKPTPPAPARRVDRRVNPVRRESDLALAGLPARVARLETGLESNTAATIRIEAVQSEIHSNTKTLIEMVQGASSIWAFMSKWAGRFRRWSYAAAKWIGAIAIAISATWAATKVVFGVDLSAEILRWWKSR